MADEPKKNPNDKGLLYNLLHYGLRGPPPADNYAETAKKLAADPSLTGTWQGPPMAGQPWDTWDAAQHEKARKQVADLDGAKGLLETWGTPASIGFSKHMPTLAQIDKQGLLDPEFAQTMARYRIMEKGLGPVPVGPRAELTMPDSAQFTEAPEGVGQAMAKFSQEDQPNRYLTNDAWYDKLAKKAPITTFDELEKSMKVKPSTPSVAKKK